MNFFKKAPTVKVRKVNKHEIQREPETPPDDPDPSISRDAPVPIDKEMRKLLLEQQRQNDRELRKAGRDLERDKANLEREEKKLEMEIKKMAKEGNNEGCKILAKQLVQLRKQKTRIYSANSKIASVQIHNKAMGANIAIAGAMGTTAKTMGNMNKVMNPHQIAKDMEAFKQANAKMDMTDEMISDTLDDIMDESGDEQESEGIVNQVLDEIGIEISGKMAGAPSVVRNKLGESTTDADRELMAQLAKLKS